MIPRFVHRLVVRFAALAALSLGSVATAQTLFYNVCIDGDQAGVTTGGLGMATVTVDLLSGTIGVAAGYVNLTGSQTVAHIHGPAPVGQGAGIILTLTGSGGSNGTVFGSGILTAPQLQELMNGLYYINIHSTFMPNGEIRGQIVQPMNVDCPAALPGDPVLTDNAGNVFYGPKIGDIIETFNVSLDCTGAGAAGVYVVELRLGKNAAPVPSPFGNIWCSGPKLLKCTGVHSQSLVNCFPTPQVLPNDTSLVGISYCVQGFCGDPSGTGRTSNGLVQVVGI